MDARCADQAAFLWDRRDVLKAATVTAGAALGAGVLQTMPAPYVPSFYRIIADTRFAESHAFAGEAAQYGQQIAWIDSDITDLWYNELDLHWRGDIAALAGLTEYGAFFCLERLALDRGFRVIFKGEHRRLADGAMSHVVFGPGAVVIRSAVERMSGRNWPVEAARMAIAASRGHSVEARRRLTSRESLARSPLLISWVLMAKPARRILENTR